MAIRTLNSWSEVESDHNKNSGKIENAMIYIDVCVPMHICVGKKLKTKIVFSHLKRVKSFYEYA